MRKKIQVVEKTLQQIATRSNEARTDEDVLPIDIKNKQIFYSESGHFKTYGESEQVIELFEERFALLSQKNGEYVGADSLRFRDESTKQPLSADRFVEKDGNKPKHASEVLVAKEERKKIENHHKIQGTDEDTKRDIIAIECIFQDRE